MFYWMVSGWTRDGVVIDNGSVLVHRVPELPGFHLGTYPRRLNCQVFTSGRFIFLYFFDFLTLDLAGMILAFFSYFWLFVQIFWIFWMFLDFVDFSHFWLFFGIFHWLLECSILLLVVGTPNV